MSYVIMSWIEVHTNALMVIKIHSTIKRLHRTKIMIQNLLIVN